MPGHEESSRAERPASELQEAVLEKLLLAFGEPHRVVGADRHWALRALSYVAAINVLVNGGFDGPVVWVFDPHDPADGVTHKRIRHVSEIDELIARIEERVKTAGRPRRGPGG